MYSKFKLILEIGFKPTIPLNMNQNIEENEYYEILSVIPQFININCCGDTITTLNLSRLSLKHIPEEVNILKK